MKLKRKKLERLLRIIEKRNLEGKPYRFYWDILFVHNTEFLERHSGDSVNDNIEVYKILGL